MSGVGRLVAQDAAPDLFCDAPERRGEAALLVAATGDRAHEPRLLELARDPDPAARHRALLALGLLASPAAVARLEASLQTVQARSSDDGVVAAYALGIVPETDAATSVARTLSRFRRGSWQRQHDALLALLQAMATRPDRAELGALRLLHREESMRAPDLRGALLALLLPIDRSLQRSDLDRVLRRGCAPERRALVRWVAQRSPAPRDGGSADGWRQPLLRLAARDGDAKLRALALDGLARRREPRGRSIAARALGSIDPDERRSAAAAMFAIGGPAAHEELEQHILSERDLRKVGALLEGLRAPPSRALVERAAALAADADAPSACRVAAGELLGRSAPARAAPLLQELFRSVSDPALLVRLGRGLVRGPAPPPPPAPAPAPRPLRRCRAWSSSRRRSPTTSTAGERC